MQLIRSRAFVVTILLMVCAAPGFSQTASDKPSGDSRSADEVSLLKEEVAGQQKQIQRLEAAMAEMQRRMGQASSSSPSAQAQAPNLGDVASTTPVLPAAKPTSVDALPASGAGSSASGSTQYTQSSGEQANRSPLEFHLGEATLKPGGFLDATAFFRTTNVGSGIGTAFGSIPFSGTTAGSLTETRFTAQNSRLSLLFQTPAGSSTSVKSYVEADFLGFLPTNAHVTSNINSLRLRLYWADITHGNFEFIGGESWSLMTPNRNGLSAVPADIFYSQAMDTNYQVGLTWARQLGFRFIYHLNKEWTAGLALEDPQQYVGPAVVLPGGSPSPYATQVDNGTLTATPNLVPDIIAKVAWDPTYNGKHTHVEVVGLLRTFKTFTQQMQPTSLTTTTTVGVTNTATGGGGALNVNFEVIKNLHLILNGFYSNGGGRYIFGLGPDLIVKPDGSPGLVHSGSGIGGFEWQPNSRNQFYGYYGAAYYLRNIGVVIDPKTGKSSFVGFGFPGSSSASNKSIQEGTFGVIQTFWKNVKYGSLQLITQYSYLTRAPWSVASGAPKNGHLSMVYADIRYTLP